jgi:alpha-galactosidase
MKNHLRPLLLLGLMSCSLPVYAGAPPVDDTPFIRTPPAPDTPRINGPSIFGARPGHPFLYHVPVTGQRPITITATALPEGLTLDSATGNITGAVAQAGRAR